MAKAAKKKPAPMIVFSRARDIPFNRIRLSDSNVRETDIDVGLDELTSDIERREDLVQGLNVRAILDADGNETGDFETPAGGRRYRSIARLVKTGRFPEDGLVPCIVKKADAKTSAIDDSLAENTFRLALHPLDQFKAFKRMVDGGMSTKEVASAYFTTQRYVEQRLVLAKVSPVLHEVYAQNGMTLATLEAFTAHPDHGRQEQVWDAVKQSYYREPWRIRQMLTETSVPASDKRALFVGIDAYIAAGGSLLPRYLFDDDGEGWLEDVPLLDRLVAEKLKAAADEIATEGWKWIAVDINLPYGYDHSLRALAGTFADLTDEERAARDALREEYDRLEAEYEGADELPDEIDQRLGEIETALKAFEKRPMVYDPADIAIAGVFIGIDADGSLLVDRGYVRSEDEPQMDADGAGTREAGGAGADSVAASVQRAVITLSGQPAEPEEEEEDAIKPLPERLVTELTAHRTLALRDAVGANPHVALTALLYKVVRDTFQRASTSGASLQASVTHVFFREQGKDLAEAPYAKSVMRRHEDWKAELPNEEDALWDWLATLDEASRLALLAHCVAYGINALYERPNPYSTTGISQAGLDRRMAEADRLARAVGLDMVDAGFRTTAENYLGRVTKPRILEAVWEGAGERAAQLIDHLKKGDMAKEAERLLADSGWLPEPLRRSDACNQGGSSDTLPAFLSEDIDEDGLSYAEENNEAPMIAAE
ncbi:ParB/RepB/Spo0J family partition protein [Phyllobacterium leguminum]|uniref:ParB family chromosome partitioning protein n=1 Tax=Phyllobacterium leguminum TaxID=314237 RepID=A0A318T3X4_9HYPH|nr:chromosome partitioning protein ParB [Phyllobacterium leguminum]PYE87561.1 ParB family chromosome partitioning protein [Phyllobacterium leguminum]